MRATTNKARTAKRICDNTQARREYEKQYKEHLQVAKGVWDKALNGDLKAVKMILDSQLKNN